MPFDVSTGIVLAIIRSRAIAKCALRKLILRASLRAVLRTAKAGKARSGGCAAGWRAALTRCAGGVPRSLDEPASLWTAGDNRLNGGWPPTRPQGPSRGGAYGVTRCARLESTYVPKPSLWEAIGGSTTGWRPRPVPTGTRLSGGRLQAVWRDLSGSWVAGGR